MSFAAATAAQPAQAAAKPPAPAQSLAIGPALQRQLLKLYAGYRQIPVSDVAPVAPGMAVAAQVSGGQDWAMIHFQVASGAPQKLLVAFQDGAGTGIFTRAPGHAWTVAGLAGEPMGCGLNLPASVRQAWHLASCPAPANSPLRPATPAAAAGTTTDLVNITLAQVGVSTNPRATGFNGLDCNPYTMLVGNPDGAPTAGCGRSSNGTWFHNVQDASEFWCADFTKWVWEKAGVTSDRNVLTPSAASFYTWGADNGEHISFGGTPKAADAVLLYPQGTSSPNGNFADHVGIITRVYSNGNVDVVDGDFLENGHIAVWKDTNVSLTPWAGQVEAPGEKWALVSPKLKSSSSSPAAVPGSPAVSDPLASTLEVYGPGSGGALQESFWAKANGWTTLPVPGSAGLVGGRPSAVYDPLGKNLEVYATAADGNHLVENYYAPGNQWRSQLLDRPAAATLAGSPSAVYDPAGKHLEVYVSGSDGKVQEFYWAPGGTWQTQELPAPPSPVTASPSAVYDPLSNVLEVYATGKDGRLEEDFWTQANGWQATELPATPSPLTGTPSAVSDPAGKHLEVYATGTDAKIQELYYAPGDGWKTQELPAPPSPATASPSAVYDPLSNTLEVYATGHDGRLDEDFWTQAGGWQTFQPPAAPFTITGTPAAVYDQAGKHLEVYALTSTGHLGEYYYAPGSPWKNQTLPSATLTSL